MNENVKGVIFDLDDLIIDTDTLNHQAWRSVLVKNSTTISIADFSSKFSARFHNRKSVECASMLIQEFDLKKTQDELVKERNIELNRILGNGIKAREGLPELLHSLYRDGYDLALATAAKRWYAEAVLTNLGIRKLFTILLASEDVTHIKPDPEVYQKAAKSLNLTPSECLAIEDDERGLTAAITAGIRCLVVPTVWSQSENLTKAVFIAKDIPDAAGWIQRLRRSEKMTYAGQRRMVQT